MDVVQLAQIIKETHTPPGWWVVLVTGLVAGGIAVSSSRVMLINVVGVVAHEAGHAAAAIITGGGVRRIQISSHDSGETVAWGRSTFSVVAVGAAGYMSPALAGWGMSALVDVGRSSAALAIVVGAMLLVLLVSRDLPTVTVVFGIGLLAAVVLCFGPWWLHMWTACLLAQLLLFGGAVHLTLLTVERIRGISPGPTDAEGLEDATGVPALLWIVGWFAVIGWCLWSSTRVLWL